MVVGMWPKPIPHLAAISQGGGDRSTWRRKSFEETYLIKVQKMTTLDLFHLRPQCRDEI